MAQSWPWGSQIVVKKNFHHYAFLVQFQFFTQTTYWFLLHLIFWSFSTIIRGSDEAQFFFDTFPPQYLAPQYGSIFVSKANALCSDCLLAAILPNVRHHLLINGVKNGEIIISKVNETFKIPKLLPRHCFIHNGQSYIIFFFPKYFCMKERVVTSKKQYWIE